jgi:hypothetical protein
MEKKRRNRIRQLMSLEDRLDVAAKSLRERGRRATGSEREVLLRKARKMDEARDIAAFLALRPLGWIRKDNPNRLSSGHARLEEADRDPT